MPGLVTVKYKFKQIVWVTERWGLNTMKYAYDLHTVHTAILQKNYKLHLHYK
jgi:hypothetical protein